MLVFHTLPNRGRSKTHPQCQWLLRALKGYSELLGVVQALFGGCVVEGPLLGTYESWQMKMLLLLCCMWEPQLWKRAPSPGVIRKDGTLSLRSKHRAGLVFNGLVLLHDLSSVWAFLLQSGQDTTSDCARRIHLHITASPPGPPKYVK